APSRPRSAAETRPVPVVHVPVPVNVPVNVLEPEPVNVLRARPRPRPSVRPALPTLAVLRRVRLAHLRRLRVAERVDEVAGEVDHVPARRLAVVHGRVREAKDVLLLLR